MGAGGRDVGTSTRRGGRAIAIAIAAVAGLAWPSGAEAAFGDISQKASPNGCVSDINPFDCVAVPDVSNGRAIAISPDGTSAYFVSALTGGGAVLVFDRAADGTLTRKTGDDGCISEDGTGSACMNGKGLAHANNVTVSPDGNTVYVVSGDTAAGAVAVFDRDPDGTLQQLTGTAGCISEDGSGGECFDGAALRVATDVAVSPDGASVYVTSASSHAVAAFDRAADGSLTEIQCFTDGGGGPGCAGGVALTNAEGVAVSPDGGSVYVVSSTLNAMAIFVRAADGSLQQDPGAAGCLVDDFLGGSLATAVCTKVKWLRGPDGVAVSPDGRSVYAAARAGDAIVVLDRAADGTLTQKPGKAGCFANHLGTTDPPPDRSCTEPFGRALDGPTEVEVAPDGKSLLVASNVSDAVVNIARAPDGTLSVVTGPGGCVALVSVDACPAGFTLDDPTGVALSPNGDTVYVGTAGGIAVLDRARGCTITGTAGKNKLTGTAGDDVICGMGGPDTIDGAGGSDIVFGDSGNDQLLASGGVDELNGGAGAKDRANFAGANQGVEADLGSGTVANDGRGSAETIYDVEQVRGAPNQTNQLTGDGEANALYGGSVNDVLVGANGDDDLHPGLGSNSILGGNGSDTLNYGEVAGGVTVAGANGDGSTTGAATDTFTGIENVWGSKGADTISMPWLAVASDIRGRKGGDFLAANDRSGSDRLHGGEDSDTCSNTDGDARARCELP